MVEPRRKRILTFAVFLLVVAAIATTAATVTSIEGGELGFGDEVDISEPRVGSGEDDIDPGDINRSGGNTTRQDPIVDLRVCITALQRPSSILAIVLSVGLVLGLLYYRFNLATTFLVGTALVPPIFGSYFFLTNCPGSGPLDDFGGGGPSFSGGGGGAQSLPIPPEAVAGVLALLTGIAVVAAVVSTRGDEVVTAGDEDEEVPEVDTDEFGAAAQRAVDRIQQANVPVDNAVYEAWVEMTGLLEMPNPEVRTPRDFAQRAVETGLNEDDVWELTELFVEVRYGEASTEGREERALDILGRFADAYGAENDSTEPSGER